MWSKSIWPHWRCQNIVGDWRRAGDLDRTLHAPLGTACAGGLRRKAALGGAKARSLGHFNVPREGSIPL